MDCDHEQRFAIPRAKEDLVPFPYPPMSVSTDLVASSISTDASSLTSDSVCPPSHPASKTSEDSFPWTSTPNSLFASPSVLNVENIVSPDPDVKKSPGLIRRIPQGAQARFRRRSVTQALRQLHTAGPVVVRRPSDLASVADVDPDLLAELELSGDEDDAYLSSSIVSIDSINALGLTPVTPSPVAFEGAPTISSVLEQGTWVQKVTKKSRKAVKLWLESSSAKVCWQTSKKDTTKPKSSKQFFIDDIREIRLGTEARNSRQDIQITPQEEERWMTVIYDSSRRSTREIKTMHFIAPNSYILKLWIEALKSVERERIEIMNALSADHDKSARSMQLAWTYIMARRESENECRLTVDDAQVICSKLEINCGLQTIKTNFELADADRRASLDYAQYERFIGMFKVRRDIQAVYDRVKTGPTLSLGDFLAFVTTVQQVKDIKYWETKFFSLARKHNCPGASTSTMTVEAFQKFLTCNSNACMAPASMTASLDRPLNDYFISSSHNTYLMGRQVAGDSTVEGYINALARGCRCVEVDCWDGKDGRPMVNHGRTLSTEVLFEDCIHVINKYAFTSSPYPLIVSLEVHCGAEQQAAMVEITTRIFGAALVLEPISEVSSLPSPEKLRGRILIKVKSHQPFDAQASTPISPISNSPILSPVKADAEDESIPDKKIKTSNITPLLAALGVYVRGMKYSDFAAPGASMYNHVFSLAETAYAGLCKEDLGGLEAHNSRYLMRVYPARMRLDSSNFNPLASWRHGVQMAALNWQTNDVNMQVNHAMFDAGRDRTGYVLKPLDMRQPCRGTKFVKFSMDVISAQRLPRARYAPEVINPYIQIEILAAEDQPRGVIVEDGETSSGLCTRTRAVQGNGFNPQFDARVTASVETKYPELVFVRWTVWSADKTDTMVATFTAKLDSLRQGYRHLPLYNTYGERYREAKLFIKLEKDEPIALNSDGQEEASSPRLERSWSRKIFSRTPSMRSSRRDRESRGSTRQSSPDGFR